MRFISNFYTCESKNQSSLVRFQSAASDSVTQILTQFRAFLKPQGTTGLGDMIHVVSIMCWTSSIAM